MVSLFLFTLPQGPCCALPEFWVCSDPQAPAPPTLYLRGSSSVGLHTRPQVPGSCTPIPSPLLTAPPRWTADLQVIPSPFLPPQLHRLPISPVSDLFGWEQPPLPLPPLCSLVGSPAPRPGRPIQGAFLHCPRLPLTRAISISKAHFSWSPLWSQPKRVSL